MPENIGPAKKIMNKYIKKILCQLYMLAIFIPGYSLACLLGKADDMPTPGEMKRLLNGEAI